MIGRKQSDEKRAKDREKQKAYAKRHPERVKARYAKWAEENPEKLKRNAHARNIKRYGLTLDDYDRMHAQQGGVCAICRRPETAMKYGVVQRLSVDHEHQTRRVRSLLCQSCNNGIGRFGEDVDRLRAAVEYLEGWRKC